MMIERKVTRGVKVGGVTIGGGALISVQSMTTTKTEDVKATVLQINRLQEAGCDLVRVAVKDQAAAKALKSIKSEISIPLVADIHFDYKLALSAIENGADKIRINPGNIGSNDRVLKILDKAKERSVAIRIGVNFGSLHKKYREMGGGPARALVESALEYGAFFEENDFIDFIISVKASTPTETIEAYTNLSTKTNAPLHIGLTEAGTLLFGSVKSSVVLGVLLSRGIGDTLRVSLSDDPVHEVRVGHKILAALDLRREFVEIISCPTCARCEVDLTKLAREVEERLAGKRIPIKVAVMGCAVNGPGEARKADIGIAAGRKEGLLFVSGKPVKKVAEAEMLDVLVETVLEMGGRDKFDRKR